ncbi:TniB family NTP-binding protein [Pseudomonas sp. 10S4]|uniref:TniB family NTP-binding protein n=1 Tax=Pseudomonas sp. 10S4 TaxID=3048583 RepID=UPI002AC91953|nr:TniB family NTP-binding protein [Pseudomonas sp. 10S4]WPX17285.1 TniB family NTP-binding protein [Pseudomonas sp. 10S4]
MEKYEHILTDKRSQADLDDRQRIKICKKDIWIPTKRLDPLFETIDYVLMSEDQLQAPGMLIFGNGGYGKSAIIRRLEQMYAVGDQRIKAIGVGEDLDNSKLRDLICDAFGIKLSNRRNTRERTSRLLHIIRSEKFVALLIDELHDTGFKTLSQQTTSLSLMKHLAGPPLFLCLICFGDERAKAVLDKDDQISRRYIYWPLTLWTDDADFCDFLATYESHLPLRLCSDLASKVHRRRILKHSHGNMDNIVKIIKACAIDAIVTGQERIMVEQVNDDIAHALP